MSKRKQKYKGVGYIANVLRKYAGKRFPTRNSAQLRAREIADDIQQTGQRVTVKSVMSFVRVKRQKKWTPELPKSLTEKGQHYFRLVDYPGEILLKTRKEITFTSKISPADLPNIIGGSEPDYELYFTPFVNYCNALKAMTDENEKRYETEWFVRCTEPDKNGHSDIISCDLDGNEFDYGFDRKKPSKKPKELVVTGKEKPPEEKPEEKPTLPGEEKKPEKPSEIIEVEKEKTLQEKEKSKQEYFKSLNKLMELLEKGMIDKKEFNEMYADLKTQYAK